ncbi:MAG: 2-hydroxyglutaryl-CoA dehydratase [Myxococcota bacterium]
MTTVRLDDLRLNGADPNPKLDVDDALARFEAEERARLGLDELDPKRGPYVEQVHDHFTADQRAHTTMLVGGLTMAQDKLVEGALRGLGYKMQHIDVPDYEALRIGKEFGNRGQCNPTWFTVGNLVKTLMRLRDSGLSTEEIIDNYIFLTAGACGPCRFGMYVTEYRKALRDAGFDGFRVVLFQQQGGFKQATGEEIGLELSPPFFIGLVKALVVGDLINAVGYRLRPYELEEGATDRAVEEAKKAVYDSLLNRTSLLPALLKARRAFSKVKVDRTRVKPKVAIIGEFWAMTTEGDGNYRMQRFLEGEGAEVDVQLVSAWLMFMLWENIRDTQHRMTLRRDDTEAKGLAGKKPWLKVAKLKAAEHAFRALFQTWGNVFGLHGYHLPDMYEIADIAGDFYDNEVRGGEAHMEVGKVIQNVVHSKVNMTLSVKPFGCMPSSSVSDGVQSAVTELHPSAIFLPIETTGDGAVNVQSRVQMMLFKARQQAQREVDTALDRWDMTMDEVRTFLDRVPVLKHPLFKPPHHHGTTAADTVELVGRLKHPVKALRTALGR